MQKKNVYKKETTHENGKISAETSIHTNANATANTRAKANEVQKYVQLQLKCKHIMELARKKLTLHCNVLVDNIIECTTNPAKILVNPLYNTL